MLFCQERAGSWTALEAMQKEDSSKMLLLEQRVADGQRNLAASKQHIAELHAQAGQMAQRLQASQREVTKLHHECESLRQQGR
jgi:phage shock protein A